MMINQLLILNILSYIFIYKLSFLITSKYIYPFRVADLINLFTNSLLFFIIALFFFSLKVAIIFLFINLNFFYISYSIINLINTSPRMKIILEIKKNKKISINQLHKFYNYDFILDNRLRRLQSSNQIEYKDSKISLKDNKFNFFKIIIFIMNIIKKV